MKDIPKYEPISIDQAYENLAFAVVVKAWDDYCALRVAYDNRALTRPSAIVQRRTFYKLKRLERAFNSAYFITLTQCTRPIMTEQIYKTFGYRICDVDRSRVFHWSKRHKKARKIRRPLIVRKRKAKK